MVTSDFRPEVEIQPFPACAMHPAIIIGTVRSLWMWLDRYHVPQNVFLFSIRKPANVSAMPITVSKNAKNAVIGNRAYNGKFFGNHS